jgi:hypothetical protein
MAKRSIKLVLITTYFGGEREVVEIAEFSVPPKDKNDTALDQRSEDLYNDLKYIVNREFSDVKSSSKSSLIYDCLSGIFEENMDKKTGDPY